MNKSQAEIATYAKESVRKTHPVFFTLSFSLQPNGEVELGVTYSTSRWHLPWCPSPQSRMLQVRHESGRLWPSPCWPWLWL